jgi:protein-L-isoaspartate O-methyltransferase
VAYAEVSEFTSDEGVNVKPTDHLIELALAEQQTYYRLRAGVHDREATEYMADGMAEIVKLMSASRALTGRVAELACGTGLMTALLSQIADHVWAFDGAAEMLGELARRRLPNVTAVQQNLFRWQPEDRWDGVFFNNWLAHVPMPRLEQFWSTLSRALRPGGRVIFVDVTPKESTAETFVEGFESDGMPMVRRPFDGRCFNVVKLFWEPDELLVQLGAWGWRGTATPVGEDRGRGYVFYNVGRADE